MDFKCVEKDKSTVTFSVTNNALIYVINLWERDSMSHFFCTSLSHIHHIAVTFYNTINFKFKYGRNYFITVKKINNAYVVDCVWEKGDHIAAFYWPIIKPVSQKGINFIHNLYGNFIKIPTIKPYIFDYNNYDIDIDIDTHINLKNICVNLDNLYIDLEVDDCIDNDTYTDNDDDICYENLANDIIT